MAHPSGILVDIVGIESPDRGRSCEEHTVCGAVLELDTVVRFRAEQIDVDGEEQTALAVYWVTDGIDRCRVGFLRRHLLKHKKDYDGKLAQIVEYKGLCSVLCLLGSLLGFMGCSTIDNIVSPQKSADDTIPCLRALAPEVRVQLTHTQGD